MLLDSCPEVALLGAALGARVLQPVRLPTVSLVSYTLQAPQVENPHMGFETSRGVALFLQPWRSAAQHQIHSLR